MKGRVCLKAEIKRMQKSKWKIRVRQRESVYNKYLYNYKKICAHLSTGVSSWALFILALPLNAVYQNKYISTEKQPRLTMF